MLRITKQLNSSFYGVKVHSHNSKILLTKTSLVYEMEISIRNSIEKKKNTIMPLHSLIYDRNLLISFKLIGANLIPVFSKPKK